MATRDLVSGCAREDLAVTPSQLARWAGYGLMPRPHKRGLGRMRGSEQRWAAECLPRAIIIARTLLDGDPSLLRAARALVDAGYTIKPELMPLLPKPKVAPPHPLSIEVDADDYATITQAAAERGLPKKRFAEELFHAWIDHYRRTGEDMWGVTDAPPPPP